MERLLTTTETATTLSLQPQTLRVWRLKGIGPKYIRVGHGPRGRVAYSQSEIGRWLEERTHSSTTEEGQ